MNNMDETLHLIKRVTGDTDITPENKDQVIKDLVRNHSTDLLNLYINIQATSVNTQDKEARTIEMCEKFGIYQTPVSPSKFY